MTRRPRARPAAGRTRGGRTGRTPLRRPVRSRRFLARLAVRAALGALVVLVGACALVNLEPLTGEDYAVDGIDVSYFQEEIDWRAVKADGVDFAFIKATEGGDRLDPRFLENFRAAAAAGLPRGAYHFWYHCRPGIEQAAWFIANVPADPEMLPPVLDMEWTPTSPTCTKRPPREEIHAEMRAFLDAIEAHYDQRPVIYVSVDFYQDRMIDAFEDYALWVRSVAGHPTVRYGNRRWHFWQHTATGTVAGVRGPVDRNVFNGTMAEFRRFVAAKGRP